MSYYINRIMSDELELLVGELTKKHWEEVDHRAATSTYNPQWDKYRAAIDAGVCHWLGVFTEDNVLVGYISVLMVESMHTGELTALTDLVYTVPEHRGNNVGKALITNAIDMSKALGAVYFMTAFKTGIDSSIPESLGMSSRETMYCKYLGG